MKEKCSLISLFILIFVQMISAQTKDVRVWVENNVPEEFVQIHFDVLYSSEVGPHWVFPGQIQAFIVDDLTKIRISIGRENLYKETKEFKYFYQIQDNRFFRVSSNKQVQVITGSELGRIIQTLPQDFTRY